MSGPALCQGEGGSCAACCGVFNFADRGHVAMDRRLTRRTRRVRQAGFDAQSLLTAKTELMAAEHDEILFAGLRVCPFAGYLDDDDDEPYQRRRIGCMIHPTRNPSGEDVRDVSVYSAAICDEHLCAPHDWLRPRERRFAQCARGPDYGWVVSDAGLVKAFIAVVDEVAAKRIDIKDVERAESTIVEAWCALLDGPYRDNDPSRFGGFTFDGDEAHARAKPFRLGGQYEHGALIERLLTQLATRNLDEEEEPAAIKRLLSIAKSIADAVEETPVQINRSRGDES